MYGFLQISAESLMRHSGDLHDFFEVHGDFLRGVPHFFADPLTFLRSPDRMQAKVAVPVDLYGPLNNLETSYME